MFNALYSNASGSGNSCFTPCLLYCIGTRTEMAIDVLADLFEGVYFKVFYFLKTIFYVKRNTFLSYLFFSYTSEKHIALQFYISFLLLILDVQHKQLGAIKL